MTDHGSAHNGHGFSALLSSDRFFWSLSSYSDTESGYIGSFPKKNPLKLRGSVLVVSLYMYVASSIELLSEQLEDLLGLLVRE